VVILIAFIFGFVILFTAMMFFATIASAWPLILGLGVLWFLRDWDKQRRKGSLAK
jgi:hypothetical protein